MTELEQIERDIKAVRDSIMIAMRTPDDGRLYAAFKIRRQASLNLYRQYLAELLVRREGCAP
ncbi:hypothetical protein R1A27_17320 [Methylobacterium sp. NMS12]|uniref:hypothetical protein n=1 Tax=Methylobacterium sp. NMS12 TaxID=3079766 RepID=UPI003F88446B